jgi:hypothetical protein
MTEEIPVTPEPKKRGWPKGKKRLARDKSISPRAAAAKYDALPNDDEDRLKIAKEDIPDGMDYQWVTDSVLGQPMPQRRGRFERRGWKPVPASRHDGLFMPKGFQGEINVDGLVLMERPMELSMEARRREKMKAAEQVYVREAALRGGDLGPNVTFDTTHPSAQKVNRVSKSYERVNIPGDDD